MDRLGVPAFPREGEGVGRLDLQGRPGDRRLADRRVAGARGQPAYQPGGEEGGQHREGGHQEDLHEQDERLGRHPGHVGHRAGRQGALKRLVGQHRPRRLCDPVLRQGAGRGWQGHRPAVYSNTRARSAEETPSLATRRSW